ncbi:MAG: lytic transglycosylase domain-containing protein [Pseudomonadota bacterium]
MAALLLWLHAPAVADVWGYIDAAGVAHFAAEPVDARYELFFKGGPNLVNGVAIAEPAPTAAGARSRKLLTFFEISSNYKSVRHLLREAAQAHNIEFELLQALIATESGFDPVVVSPRGAVGLMQVLPTTAERYGMVASQLADPRTNIRAGARHLRTLMDLFPGRLDLTLAAYNAGDGAVRRAGNRVPDYPETQNYVTTVMALYTELKPPLAVQQRRQANNRLLATQGGALGRGNMVLPATAQRPALDLPPGLLVER